MKRKQKITLSDIAKHLGVSTVTVSKALRGQPDISESMKKSVQATAQKMGYIPNRAASLLSSKRSNTIGLIIPKIAHSFFSSLIESIYENARLNNYEIILTSSQEDSELQEKHLMTMISMKVDGIIISVTRDSNDKKIYDIVKANKIPIIEIDRTVDDSLTQIVFDDIGGTEKAIDHAIKLGYKKIAFVGGNHSANIGKDRLKGYMNSFKKNGLAINEKYIFEGGFKEIDGYKALKYFYENNILPEMIFAATYPVALGVVSAARELKLKIPRDIDLISFGDSEFNKFIKPAISCVNQETNKMGELAVKKMIELIESKGNSKPEKIVIESELLIKDTCKQKVRV
ncbi:MAG: LacI family transcriptional regulator [Ignavibacteria bacterium]|nr:MAG: LacI family transcriptional regulator [Ignavibacteria bacterium]